MKRYKTRKYLQYSEITLSVYFIVTLDNDALNFGLTQGKMAPIVETQTGNIHESVVCWSAGNYTFRI